HARPLPLSLAPFTRAPPHPPPPPPPPPDRLPPHRQPVHPAVARLALAEDQRQRPAGQHQDAQRRPLPLRRRVMVPPLGRLALRVGPPFFPPASIPPRSPWPWRRRRSPASPGRPGSAGGRLGRYRRRRRSPSTSSAVWPSGCVAGGSPGG